jgi:hypothetical protein
MACQIVQMTRANRRTQISSFTPVVTYVQAPLTLRITLRCESGLWKIRIDYFLTYTPAVLSRLQSQTVRFPDLFIPRFSFTDKTSLCCISSGPENIVNNSILAAEAIKIQKGR